MGRHTITRQSTRAESAVKPSREKVRGAYRSEARAGGGGGGGKEPALWPESELLRGREKIIDGDETKRKHTWYIYRTRYT